MTRKPILAIDFDDVIADYSAGWQGERVYGEPIAATVEKLRCLKKRGWRILIWTCRSESEYEDLIAYLNRWGIPFDSLNEQIESFTNSRKVYADIYLDDRGFRFDPDNPWQSWESTEILLQEIERELEDTRI